MSNPTLKFINEKYFHIEEWEYHKRSKNYIAKITGKHSKFKYNREFLSYIKIDGKACFEKEELEVGRIYEIKCIYYTGSGKPSSNLSGFFEWDGEGFNRINEAEVLSKIEKPKKVNPLEKFSDNDLIKELERRGYIIKN